MKKLLLFVCFLLTSHSLFAQLPRTISYQGILKDGSGAIIPDGSHSLTVKLYEQASGGVAMYEESHLVVFVKGLFSIIIGRVTPIPPVVSFDKEYYLGISVDGGNELLPRTPLTSAPYALFSGVAQVAHSLSATATGALRKLNGGEGDMTLQGSGGTTISRSGDTITIFSSDSDDTGPWTTSGTNISNTNTGNVGIGTNSPATKLEVNGTTRTRDIQITAGASSGRTLVSNSSGTAVWTTDIKIVGGNIGIGDTTPKAKLHVVAGSSGFDPTFTRSMVIEEDGNLTLSLRGPAALEQSILFERPVGDTGLRISSQPDGDMRIGRYRFTDNGSASSSFQLFLDVQTGNFGIGRDPVSNDLELDGAASKTTAGDWLANSDRRIKTDIVDIEESFKTLLRLRPVMFRYSNEWRRRNPSIEDRYYYNFIAQEYQQVFPDAVKKSGEYLNGDSQEILQIDTYDAQIVTIKAVQDLIQENSSLKEGNAILQKRVENIETELADIKRKIQSMSAMSQTASFQK